MAIVPTVVIHGGAWAIPDAVSEASRLGVCKAARSGYRSLSLGSSVVDAVEVAVRVLEDLPIFDAGTGSVLTVNGEVEMDSVIMDGSNLRVGAVACVNNMANPISLARKVMDESDYTLLVGPGANAFAAEHGFETRPMDELVTQAAKDELQQYLTFTKAVNVCFRPQISGHDTVGAVAIDRFGNVAFGTSTGGISAKRPGRVGDSPLVGCGGYSDNDVGTVSTTGHGESITKVCMAYRITTNMKQGLSPQEAITEALGYMSRRVQGFGGAIAINVHGQVGYDFTTERMPWAVAKEGSLTSGINPGDEFKEKL